MNALVTGGAGFIGSHLVDALLERPDACVRVLDTLERGRLENLTRHTGDPHLVFVHGDVRDLVAVRGAMADVDVVFHLAARSSVLDAECEPRAAFEVNVGGTYNVLEAALAAGVRRVVFASSREVYGEPRDLPVGEETPLDPRNVYGTSKAAAELYCRVFCNSGLETAILRLSNVYGARDIDRVIPRWIARALDGAPLEVYGGDQVIDFVPVRVVVQALLRAATADVAGVPINVAAGVGTPILTLARRILAQTGSRSELRVLPARSPEVRCFVADTRRLRALLGIEPPAEPLCDLAALCRAPAGTPQ